MDMILYFLKAAIKAWQSGSRAGQAVIVLATLSFGVGVSVWFAAQAQTLDWRIGQALYIGLFGIGGALIVLISALEQIREEKNKQQKIEKVEQRAREHPEKPQLAWDLARTKLENYLDKNLGQLRSIFWLTLFVMLVGFGFVLFGLIKAYDRPETLPVSVVGSVSGVVISFIGGSFLLIYRSILAQTRRYVSVLERINAVGMAVQVLASISDESKELKNNSIAALARQLISLYSPTQVIEANLDDVAK